MVGLAAALFVGVFGFGNEIFGWSQYTLHEVQTRAVPLVRARHLVRL
jgi:hypothetical protein